MVHLGNPFQSNEPVSIHKEVIQKLMNHALDVYPQEASALLGGKGSHITHIILIPNGARQKKISFAWKPAHFLKGLLQLEALKLDWLGVVHSHPRTAPIPSRTDIDNWHYHQLTYWILSLERKEEPILSMYRFLEGSFFEKSYIVKD